MSYREQRNFCELMRELGYTRKISLENFKEPNFELVAEILYWLVMRYDPTADISDNIDEELDRVDFIKSVVQLFATKGRIKLNPKTLYESGPLATRELLKIADMLNKAIKASSAVEDEDAGSMLEFNLSSKLYNLKQARQLATEITETGAKLYDLLGKEKELRESRKKALDFLNLLDSNIDSDREHEYIEKCIRDIISSQSETVSQMEKMVENLKQDEENLEQKIKRRQDEFERADKRLISIENSRPPWKDEYEQLEGELERLYLIYVEKFRNLDYLEHELDLYNQKQQQIREASEQALQSIRERIKEEELKILRGEADIDEAAIDAQVLKGVQDNEMREAKIGFNPPPVMEKKDAIGNPLGPDDEEESSENEELELNDSEEIIDDDEDEDELTDSEVIPDDEADNDF